MFSDMYPPLYYTESFTTPIILCWSLFFKPGVDFENLTSLTYPISFHWWVLATTCLALSLPPCLIALSKAVQLSCQSTGLPNEHFKLSPTRVFIFPSPSHQLCSSQSITPPSTRLLKPQILMPSLIFSFSPSLQHLLPALLQNNPKPAYDSQCPLLQLLAAATVLTQQQPPHGSLLSSS